MERLPMDLLPGQVDALRNLARKQAGEDVDFINIAHARALTEYGLAERDRGGWRITPAGLADIKARTPEDVPPRDTGATPLRRMT